MNYRQEKIKKIRKYYDEFLASEPGKYSSLEEFKSRFEPVISFFQKINKNNLEILDVGCGTGQAAEKLKIFGKVYGIDISPKSIEEAKKRLNESCVGLAEELPFPNGMFDVVVCTETIEHLLNPSKGLKEMNRVLKPGGYLIISTPNPWYWQIILNKIISFLKRRGAGSGQIVENLISPIRLKNIIRKNGFQIEEFRTEFFRPRLAKRILNGLLNNFCLYQICLAKNKGIIKNENIIN